MLRLMLTLILYVGAGCPDPNAHPQRPEHRHEPG
jgi:hypothetical protein